MPYSRESADFLKVEFRLTMRRDAEVIGSEKGQKREERVWHEIIDSLRKDVPEVIELAKA